MGGCLGEVAFFTEIPQMQTVRTVTVCRVLVVPRTAYQTIKSAFPLGTRQMLDNLQAHAELVGHSQLLNEAAYLSDSSTDLHAVAESSATRKLTEPQAGCILLQHISQRSCQISMALHEAMEVVRQPLSKPNFAARCCEALDNKYGMSVLTKNSLSGRLAILSGRQCIRGSCDE